MQYQQLETERLILRNFNPSDLPFVFKHFSSSFVSQYLYDNEPPQTPEEAGEILGWAMEHNSNHIRWCIVLKETSEQIGTIGFHKYDEQNNSAEIGYDLAEKYTQKGIMSEALMCIIQHGRTAYGLHRIYASVAEKNEASNRLLAKNGFALEGICRDQYFFRGTYYDHKIWSYITEEI